MKRIPTLDGWRAVAILLVIIHHAGQAFHPSEDAYYANSLTVYGAFGVDVFFGLSGLLITKLLLEEWRSGDVSLRAFYIRRVFRIVPPYLLLMVVITVAGLWTSTREAVSSLFFFRNYVPESGRWSQHLWSLAVEEHFYLLWPGLLVLVGKYRGRKVAAGVAIAVGIWRIIEAQTNMTMWLGAPPHLRTDLRLDALLWGCAAAFLLEDTRERERFTQQFRFGVWLTCVAISLVCVALYSLMTSIWLAALIPMLLAATVVHPEWRVSRVLEWRPLTWIGRISYSLYLWQQLFLVPAWEHPKYFWLRWPWNVIAAFVVGALSYRLVEQPLLRVGRRLAAQVRSSPAVPVAAADTVLMR